jgi:hypothetical protein
MSRLDKYRRSHGQPNRPDAQSARALDRRHKHIATEAARRIKLIVDVNDAGELKRTPNTEDLYAAKMQAVAVLGLSVKPGELPSDELVMEIFETQASNPEPGPEPEPLPAEATAGELPNEAELAAKQEITDRFELYLSLLRPLEQVKQHPKMHPEGDALFHSLQVFEGVRETYPYDEEVLTAALLHDIGKALEPGGDHHAASMKALKGRITDRTRHLINRLADAHDYCNGTLGHRGRRSLENDLDFEHLMVLAEADQKGRKPGADVPSVEEAIEIIKKAAEYDCDIPF